MHAVLFRKIEIDGVNYYQLFNEIEDFKPDDDFTDYFHRGEKEYFYIDADSDIEIPDASLLNIYYDKDDGIINITDEELFKKVFEVFADKYNIVISKKETTSIRKALLFRMQEVDGIKYYQYFAEYENFVPDERLTDYYHRGEKEYFYIDEDDNIEVPNLRPLNLYYDSKEGFIDVLDSQVFLKVFNVFKEKYNIVIKEIKPIDDVVDSVDRKILFQDEVIAQIVQRIYLNQSYVISELPIELKECQKTDILFHGLGGSGKKTIVKCLQDELDIPYADITLNASVKELLIEIIDNLLAKSNDSEVASSGIVYIRDNFYELARALNSENILAGYNSVAELIKYLTSQSVITYKDKSIDFRTITFVILFNDDENIIGFNEFQKLIECPFELSTRVLTNEEKYQVLFSENGSIYHYEKFLNFYGCKFIVDDKCLMELIDKCSMINESMSATNKLIDSIVSYGTYNGITDVSITDEYMDIFNTLVNQVVGDKGQKEESKPVIDSEKIEKYLFDKEVDRVFNEAKKYFIGQDKNLRLFITDVLNNIKVAEKNNLYSPQSYKLNILVRGSTGTGKTFLVDTVCKLFDIPYVSIDSSQYTETGFHGSSISEIFASLYNAAGNDLEKAQKGIVFLDEIDKKSDSSGDRSAATTKAVLHELLKPTEGTTIRLNVGTERQPEYVEFDTSRVTFICAGAFDGIEEIRDKRVGKRNCGFGAQDSKKEDEGIINDDYIAYGMPSEFMGRVKTLIDLDNPTIESILNILNNSELSALKIAKFQFSLREIDIDFTEEFCRELAKLSIERKQGVRGVGNLLERILQRINHQDIRASEVEKIILDKDVIYDPSKVILIPREKQKIKKLEK